ncbi:FecR family protein [Cellulophaga tyrosinoxydans]|uniref:FecR family protein n=1 Tax=Cellulophaga tyrosinoxydans TaxID=504486 RepID=A0A1W2ART2_9FLAO|nr:FecR family protein [Cellulophaga tyrosinoxydans]SMC63427.1 FecR family protein [Cellulophaga tyrosinoxydans]
MQENYLAKWLNNELTKEELEVFKNTDEYASYKKIADASSKLQAPNFDIDKALNDSIANRPTSKDVKVIRLNPFKKLLRIAAVVLVLVTGSYFYYNSLDETLKTDLAENKSLVLPDASTVFLNADSKLSYNKNNWDENRKISLNGEAYFKVAKGKKFTVETSEGLVTVLGTQFNVENRKGFFEVTCYEGLVSVTHKNKTIKLPGGNSFLVINNEIIATEAPNTSAPSWITNESTFKSIPMLYVIQEFERQYNITVDTKNIDTNILYTGTFTNKNIELALKSICLPNQIKFKLEKNKVLLYAENAP